MSFMSTLVLKENNLAWLCLLKKTKKQEKQQNMFPLELCRFARQIPQLWIHEFVSHDGSMWLVYLPIHEWLMFMVNVSKYAIHGYTWILWVRTNSEVSSVAFLKMWDKNCNLDWQKYWSANPAGILWYLQQPIHRHKLTDSSFSPTTIRPFQL